MKLAADLKAELFQIVKARLENLSSDPAFNSAEQGRVWIQGGKLKLNNGTAIVALRDTGTALVNGDISGSAAIAYSKLALSNSITNADINASAAIAKSKLALANSITNADINTSAAIALSKLAVDPVARANHTGTQVAATISDFSAAANSALASALSSNSSGDRARANHTGTQTASTISDFNAAAVAANAPTSTADRARANHTGTQAASTISDLAAVVKAYKLNEFAAPTGTINFGNQQSTNVPDPLTDTAAANKRYVDSLVQGVKWKAPVKVKNTANLLLEPRPGVSGSIIVQVAYMVAGNFDGVAPAPGDRVLIDVVASGYEEYRGIYICETAQSGVVPLRRADDADTWDELVSAGVLISEGTAYHDTLWTCDISPGGTLETTSIGWIQIGGVAETLAGSGLKKTGNTIDAVLGVTGGLTIATFGTVGGNAIGIATQGIVAGMIGDGSVDGNALANGAVNLAGTKVTGTLPIAKGGTGGTTDPKARANHTGTQTASTISDFNAAAVSATASAISSASTADRARANHTGTQAHTTISDFDAGVQTNRLDQMATPTADIDMGGHKFTDVLGPTDSGDVTIKAYTDNADSLVIGKNIVRFASTVNVNIASAPSAYDGGVQAVFGDRILLKDQTEPRENGVYVFHGTGVALVRDAFFGGTTNPASPLIIAPIVGSIVMVQMGSQAGTGWVCYQFGSFGNGVIGTDIMYWRQFSVPSGALGVDRGGTGGTSGAQARVNLAEQGLRLLQGRSVGLRTYSEWGVTKNGNTYSLTKGSAGHLPDNILGVEVGSVDGVVEVDVVTTATGVDIIFGMDPGSDIYTANVWGF